jgi:mono/diheme cytochrome c family protein
MVMHPHIQKALPLIWFTLAAASSHAAPPDYNLDVRPILSFHCLKCHGPDDKQRQAGLRLDQPSFAVKLAKPHGSAADSLLVRRVSSHGADIMPPATANKPLSQKEIDILKQWISSGAVYKPHWAFVAPVQAPLPAVHKANWPRNPIDNFTLAAMERAGLKPSTQADRYTLVRRVYLDLIGLPPTPEQADEYLKDTRPDAYERLVDRLLASPHYGERWARRWLDLARYADTNGYEKDRPRSVWPYRDWVINALNADMPFNEFTIEQIAGDMLPNATASQRIATGFHRNTMLNEEGGIDPLEYRFYSMTDRVLTTGATWLGLTTGCAQCHSHKYDPITHADYYRMMACMNNTEEVVMNVPDPNIEAKRTALIAKADLRQAHLADMFPAGDPVSWTPVTLTSITSSAGAKVAILPDGSALMSGVNPEADVYTAAGQSAATDIDTVRLDALTDRSLGKTGPGRTPHGNFVLTGFTATVTMSSGSGGATKLHFTSAEADVAQDLFPAINALNGDPKSGWAVDVRGRLNTNHAITFTADHPIHVPAGSSWSFELDQNYGQHHTIGRFKIELGRSKPDALPSAERAKENLDNSYRAWVHTQESRAVDWRTLVPAKMTSNLPKLSQLADGSIYVSGDQTKLDVYTLDIKNKSNEGPITALRLEAIPDERLPGGGPGRVFYEGAPGDFFLSEMIVTADGKPVEFANAAQNGGSDARNAIDGNKQTGWSINGRQGQVTTAIFRLKTPLKAADISIRMEFEQYYTSPLGRFRFSATSDNREAQADIPDEVNRILLKPASSRTPAQRDVLMKQFLAVAPELQPERDAIAEIRRSAPVLPTCLVFREREPNNTRDTYIHHRGEFLSLEEKVMPGTLSFLPPLPPGTAANRLSFARWLVSPQNPLVARVTVNRQWAALFGRGIVKTTEDFGYQGDPPTNQDLLDWMAVEFEKQGWSLKKLHRLIVTSATYMQSSATTPELAAKDPENRLLARGPRVRLEAELVRDSALSASGVLSEKIGGPSVFPPQPPGVSSEGAYGVLDWKVSMGQDRYRRGLYTFSKRTAPYAMFQTFDAPSGEVCVARREISDTPLQALTLLNDQVFMETSQAAGKIISARTDTTADKADYLFRRFVTRPPKKTELDAIIGFYATQKKRCDSGELDAATVCGAGKNDPKDDLAERAAWTATARALLNLDEFITKH